LRDIISEVEPMVKHDPKTTCSIVKLLIALSDQGHVIHSEEISSKLNRHWSFVVLSDPQFFELVRFMCQINLFKKK